MRAALLEQALNEGEANAPLQAIQEPFLTARKVTLYLKREDRIHPHVSGNKWRKLKYNLIQAAAENHDTLLTFGGAYSNHILATAHAGQLFGFRTIGIIRGEEYSPLNPVLAEAQNVGMELHYMERWRYRQKESDEVGNELASTFGRFYLLPEGGTNTLAVRGCREIVDDIDIPFDVICCACGTGGTLAGLGSALQPQQKALGIAVLKGEAFLREEVEKLLPSPIAQEQLDISFDYHAGGYAKNSGELLDFIEQFKQHHEIQLDPVYTGKLMFGLYDLIKNKRFDAGQTIIAIHSGKQ